MAKDKATNPPEVLDAIAKGASTAVVTWKDRMVAIKETVQEAEKPQGGFLSFKGGRLTYGDEILPGDKINVIIINYRNENAFYPDAYKAGVNRSPECYAIRRPGEDMLPNTIEVDGEEVYAMDNVQGMPKRDDADTDAERSCDTCWANEWGSALNGGKGKACKTSRRLMVLAADDCTTPDKIARASVMTAIPPATSVENFQNVMNQITKVLDTVPFGAVVEMSVKRHDRFLFMVHFKVLQQINDDVLLEALSKRYEKENAREITYPKNSEREGAPPAQQSTKY